ncbi:hypothetical protein HanRHA438_Chr17g0835701 [Helianthus annuus]|nr:hypothetical protein HanRHA438_Chr17g0835701 [Helianthus annuus]
MNLSKLPFWSLWFGQFCHFSPNLKLITSRALWFGFCCHFGPNFKFEQISLFFYCCNLLFCPLVQGHFGHFLNFIFFFNKTQTLFLSSSFSENPQTSFMSSSFLSIHTSRIKIPKPISRIKIPKLHFCLLHSQNPISFPVTVFFILKTQFHSLSLKHLCAATE